MLEMNCKMARTMMRAMMTWIAEPKHEKSPEKIPPHPSADRAHSGADSSSKKANGKMLGKKCTVLCPKLLLY
jgi:hypothetical protein